MFNSITLDHALYNLSETQFQTFKQIANATIPKYKLNEIQLKASIEDKCGMILHLWCLLNEEKYQIVYLPEKMMIYSSDFHCIELLKANKEFAQFKKHLENSPTQQLLFAYELIKYIANWLHTVVENEHHISLKSIGIHHYYSMHLNVPETSEENHPIYRWHSYFSRIIHSNIANRDCLNSLVKDAINYTKLNFINVNSVTTM